MMVEEIIWKTLLIIVLLGAIAWLIEYFGDDDV